MKKFDLLRQKVLADAAIYESPTTHMTAEEAVQKARQLASRVREGQSAIYITPEGQTFRTNIKSVSGQHVMLFSPTTGMTLVDLIQFKPNGGSGSQWLVYGLPPDEPATSARPNVAEAAVEDLKVLRDEKAQNTIKKLYSSYVSDKDFSRFPFVLAGIDNALFEARGQVPKELEVQLDEQEPQGNGMFDTADNSGGAPSEDPEDQQSLDDFNREVQSNMVLSNYDESQVQRISSSLKRNLVLASTPNMTTQEHPKVKGLRNHALQRGFSPTGTRPR